MSLPIVSGLAGRYATALFELALEENALDKVKNELERVDKLIVENPDFALFVRCPVFDAHEKKKALVATLDEIGIGGLVAQFLIMVTANRRLPAVRDMIKAYRRLLAHHKGQTSAEVTVAEPLTREQFAAITSALKEVTGGEIDLTERVDPTLIGGLVVKIGSRMIDTSLRTKLNNVRIAMKEPR